MGSTPFSINGRPASPENFQTFVDLLKEAGLSVASSADDGELPREEIVAALDRDRNGRLTRADFQQTPPAVFSDLRSVLGRYGFHLKEEMTEEVVRAETVDSAPEELPAARDVAPRPDGKGAAPSVRAEAPPPAAADVRSVPERLGELYGWDPEEAGEKYRLLAAKVEAEEYRKHEPPAPGGEFGCAFLRGDICQHEGWRASLGRFLGMLFNPLTDAMETGEAVREARQDATPGNVLWAGLGVFGVFSPLGDLSKAGTRGADAAEEGLEEAPGLWRRLWRSSEPEAKVEIPRDHLRLKRFEEVLEREGRVLLEGKRSPGAPRVIAGPKGRIERSEALVLEKDLETGSEVSDAARDWVQDTWGLRHSDAGHVIGKQLGGKGGAYSNNLVPQSPNINRGKYQIWEGQVAAMVRKNGSAELEITVHYADEAATIPEGLTYLVRSGGVTYVKWFGNAH